MHSMFSAFLTSEQENTVKAIIDAVPRNAKKNTTFTKLQNQTVEVELTFDFSADESCVTPDPKRKNRKNRFKPEDQPFMKRAMSSSSSSSSSFKGKKVDAPIPVRVHNLPTFKPKDEQYYEVGPLTAKDNSLKERKAIWDAIMEGRDSTPVMKPEEAKSSKKVVRAIPPKKKDEKPLLIESSVSEGKKKAEKTVAKKTKDPYYRTKKPSKESKKPLIKTRNFNCKKALSSFVDMPNDEKEIDMDHELAIASM